MMHWNESTYKKRHTHTQRKKRRRKQSQKQKTKNKTTTNIIISERRNKRRESQHPYERSISTAMVKCNAYNNNAHENILVFAWAAFDKQVSTYYVHRPYMRYGAHHTSIICIKIRDISLYRIDWIYFEIKMKMQQKYVYTYSKSKYKVSIKYMCIAWRSIRYTVDFIHIYCILHTDIE